MSAWDLKRAIVGPQEDLQDLVLAFQGLKQLGGVAQLTSLRSLSLAFNALASLRGIEALQQLHALDVSHNALSGLAPVAALTRLTRLAASCNKVSSTAPLEGLAGLQLLALHGNDIAGAEEVLRLARMGSGLRHLTLWRNPVCRQQHWREATIAALPALQALDDALITSEQRAAAAAYSSTWEDARGVDFACASSGCSEDGGGSAFQEHGRLGSGGSHRCSSSSSGSSAHGARRRARPRVSALASDDISIKDVHTLLPSLSLQPSKQSTLVRRAQQLAALSRYDYGRAKPLTTLLRRMYTAGGATAVLVRSDGSASCNWPEGSMALSLDAEEDAGGAAPGGSSAGGAGGSSSGSTRGVPPAAAAAAAGQGTIRGYRLLAMYRSVTGVAVSWDSGGGFVQYPDGGLMLVYSRQQGGTAYARAGQTMHKFHKRQPLQEDVSAQLDKHLSVTLRARSHELQLAFACGGFELRVSQRHGAMLAEREREARCPQQPGGAAGAEQPQRQVRGADGAAGACAAAGSGGQQQEQEQQDGGGDSAAAALAGLPDGAALQALMLRARALMSATDMQAPATEVAPALPADVAALAVAPASPTAAGDGGGGDGGSAADDVDLRAMMARARAAMQATTAALASA